MPQMRDLEVEGLLSVLNAAFPPLGTDVVSASEARRLFEQLRTPVEDPTEVGAVNDLVVRGHAGEALPARMYEPLRASQDPRFSVLFFHGGGWVLGDLDSHDELVRQLANALRRTVVSVAYRLAPEHPYPIPLLDARAAHLDLTRRASDLGLTGPLIISGDSAGGNLAALVALEAARTGAVPVAAQVLLYPVLDARRSSDSYASNATGHYITAAHLRWFWEQYLGSRPGDDEITQASPVLWDDLTGAPPALIATAGLDPLRDEGVEYARRLQEHGCPVTLLEEPDAFHGYLGFARQLGIARRTFEDLGHAVDQLLGEEPTHGLPC